MVKEKIKKLIEESIRNLQKEKKISDFEIPEIIVEKPAEDINGDYSVNIALKLAKIAGINPFELSQIIKNRIPAINYEFIEIRAVHPGFINFFLSKEYLYDNLNIIFKKKNKLKIGKGQKINIEFISANPTGPLTLGNGRGGFCGDALGNVLKKAGYIVAKEYYINDVGMQIKKLGHSIIGDLEAVYKGEYIEKLSKKIKLKDPQKAGEKGAEIIFNKIIKKSVKKMGIKFDRWFRESELYKNKEVDKVLEELKKKGLAYHSNNVLWFKSAKFGDEKDRVLIKENGEKTYLASDIAYLKNKFKRGFKKLIFLWGADHHGYIERLKGGAEALGYKKEDIEIIIMQLVRLFEKGREVRMSKRSGIYITIDELIDEAGLDAARFFFLSRSPNSHFNFNMDIAKEKSEKNPVYYTQYAYTRICSILKKSRLKPDIKKIKLLTHPSELNLMKFLVLFPEIIESIAEDYQVQKLPQYSIDLADAFHKFYENCRVIDKNNKELTKARLALALAAKIVLKDVFDLMGISAPQKM